MSEPGNGVALSVVLPVDRYESARDLISHMRTQTAADCLELLLVVPSEAEFGLEDGAGEGLAALRTIETGEPMDYLFRARAVGIRAARAPVVALAENHCFPEPGWAEALIEAHRGPWAGVGPAFLNANPGAVSWASLLLEYGPWIDPVPPGPAENLPGHNSAYKRDELLSYGDELEAMLEAEYVMHREMRSRGLGLYLEPAARTRHVNVSRPSRSIVQRVRAGRAFAGARSAGWSLARRLLYAAGSPLIPLVRAVRVKRHLDRIGRPWPLRKLLPFLAVGLISDATGELLGYAIGGGAEAQRRMYAMDLERTDYVVARDRHALTQGPVRALDPTGE